MIGPEALGEETTMDMGRILEILSALLAFDTTSRNPNLDLVAWVEQYLRAAGVPSERLYDPTGQKASLWATLGPRDVPGYILSGHTDVVPVDGQDWSSDPFRLREAGGRLYGRGACDMKGFLAVCLAAAGQRPNGSLRAPVHLALSYDEEVGCVGGRRLAEHLSRAPVRQRACFVGEPTSMGVVIGHKGKRTVRATVRGRTGHSALAPLAVNAVEYGARLVTEITRMADRLADDGPRDDLYDVPYSTAHVGVMRGGVAVNIVPDRAEIIFEFRTIGGMDPDALVAEVVRHAREVLEPRMQAIDPATGFDFEVISGFPGLDTPPQAEVVALAKKLAGQDGHSKVAFGTEAGLFSEIAGIPTVVIGPGSIDQAHKADEWIAVDQLQACATFVDRLIERCRA
jgi:acetylornithine deacetylase